MSRLLALLVAATVFLVPTGSPASATPDHFNPRPGVTFNNPLGNGAAKRAIFRKIIRSINSSPRGSEINILSWNFLTREGTNALVRAQHRGVRVRLLMDNGNNTVMVNQPYRRLRAELHQGNKRWPVKRHSWARTCMHSCRGKGGAAHSKVFMFSQVGKVKRVVMQGSANLTLASTNNQWNDVVTHTRKLAIWRFWSQIFAQAAKDKPVRNPFASKSFHGGIRQIQFPLYGKGAHDPVMGLLNKVRCKGATNTASHRTVLRIAPDVIRNARGLALSKKVRSLWNNGCDIKIGYTVLGYDSGRLLRSSGGRGPVPMKHLVQDFNGDGEFDNYFHLKVMTIVGHINGDRSNDVVLNGSANWSHLSSMSDENLGVYWSKRLTLRYQDHLNYWYNNFPQSASSSSRPAARRSVSQGQVVFGTGKNARYEDGTRVAPEGVNPYAHVATD